MESVDNHKTQDLALIPSSEQADIPRDGSANSSSSFYIGSYLVEMACYILKKGLEIFGKYLPEIPFLRMYTVNNSERPSVLNRLDPSVFMNACKILNIPEEFSNDKELIEGNYKKAVDFLEKRKASLSVILAPEFQRLIDDAHAAYKTLMAAQPQQLTHLPSDQLD